MVDEILSLRGRLGEEGADTEALRAQLAHKMQGLEATKTPMTGWSMPMLTGNP